MDVGTLTIHLLERGGGPRVLALHHSTGPFWTEFYDRLALHNEVIAPALPGYGNSTRPETARHPSHLAVLMHQLLDREPTDAMHLIGLGFGGWVAAEMIAMNQARFASLTLVGPAGIKPRSGFIHDPMSESFTAYARRAFRDDQHFSEVFGAEPAPELVQLWDYSREMTARITWRPWMWNLTLPTLLAGVATPTLVVAGSEDQIVPVDCAQQYAEVLPNASLEVFEGAGHAVELEEPAELARRVEQFINQVA